MTKLMQWLLLIAIFGTFYISALLELLPFKFDGQTKQLIVISPVILVALFGIYSVFVILYRVATFNDCADAAAELKEEIKAAKKDLSSKGMKFD